MLEVLEKEIATSTFSGCSSYRKTKFRDNIRSYEDHVAPVINEEGLFMGKEATGPVRVQSQIKCLDIMGGGALTEAKLESEPSEKLPSLRVPEESKGKMAAMKSFI